MFHLQYATSQTEHHLTLIEFRRKPVLAHIVMVCECTGIATRGGPHEGTNTDYLLRETTNERVAALKIVERILKEYTLSLEDVIEEIKQVDIDNPYSPGEVLNLDFLKGMKYHAT